LQNTVFKRRHELDWLRIIAFFFLIIYYTGQPFIKGSGWNIVNKETSGLLAVIWHFLHTWRLPLLFMISGMGVAFAFRKRTGMEFMLERTRRLLLPLLFGVLVFVPPQIYVKLLYQGQNPGSYLSVYPAFFNGFDPPGNFTPSHLWFLVVLFVFVVIALPLFLWLKTERGREFMSLLHKVCDTRFGFYLAAIPLAGGYYLLKPVSSGFWTDWATMYFHLFIFVVGYITASKPELCEAKQKYRWTYFGLAVLFYGLYFVSYYLRRLKGLDLFVTDLFQIIAVLSLLLSLIGFARVYLNRPSRFLEYTNEAVYPYYIVQPTIIIVLSYFAVQWSIAWYLKFAFIVLVSFPSTLLIYHFLIRPFSLIRPLFGMKVRK
jgi:glucan biosynthesis protein C